MDRLVLTSIAAISMLTAACSSAPPESEESTGAESQAICADPPCRPEPGPKPKPTRTGAIASVPAPVLHTQGWDWDGCNFNGGWYSYWGSPTGTYSSNLLFSVDQSGAVSGRYNNGTLSATSYVDGNGIPVMVGTWNRTVGSSGGPCQNGNFWFRIHGDASGCYLSGLWDYCGSGQPYVWEASQPH